MGISEEIIKQIEKALDKGISKKNLVQVAKKTAASVKKRTRLGKGVAKDAEPLRRLDGLKPTYKKQRRKLKKSGKLSSKTTPAKSNLTQSGEMLDNIKSKTTSKGFEIYIKGVNNQKKAEYVQEKRPFMNLAKFEIKFIIEDIIDRIRRS